MTRNQSEMFLGIKTQVLLVLGRSSTESKQAGRQQRVLSRRKSESSKNLQCSKLTFL